MMNPFEMLMGLNYEPWILRLPAALDQCAVCGRHGVGTFDFWQNGPIPTEDICPACGFEYGGNSFLEGISFDEYRAEWKARGYGWWSSRAPDEAWDAKSNLVELARELERAKHATIQERAPGLVDYYRQCVQLTLPTIDSKSDRTLLQRAEGLLGAVRIIGGGSTRLAYRFSPLPVEHEFLLIQPRDGDPIPRQPIQLNVSASGEPVEIINVNDERMTEITPKQFAEIMKAKPK